MNSPDPRRSFDSLDSPTPSPSVRSPSTSLAARSQYPFPRHGSVQRPARQRRGSGASLASSIGGSLDVNGPGTGTGTDPVNELAHNAIANLNSPPIVRTGLVAHSSLATSSTYRAPSTRDIPPVTLTNIPHVESSAFFPYLSQVGPLYETFRRAKAASDEAAATLAGRGRQPAYDNDHDQPQQRSTSQSSSISRDPTSPGALSPTVESPATARRPSQTRRRHSAVTTTPLSTIPGVYFEEDFHLENPRTFDVVSERSDVIPQPPTPVRQDSMPANGAAKAPASRRKALHTNAILQEKLSWYMDTVEVHLISSIATASSSFFAALSSLKELQSEAEECITKIKSLRDALQYLDSDMAVGGLEIVKLNRRKENLRKLSQAVNQLCDVMDEAKACEELVEQGDLDQASARIDDLECLIAGEQPIHSAATNKPRLDLRELRVLEGFSESVLSMRSRIGKAFETKFIDALLGDLRQHVQRVPSHETMQRWANATFRNRSDHTKKMGNPAYMATNEELRPELLTALAGLTRAGHSSRAASAYRDAIMREIKSLIRRHLPSSNDDDAESMASISTTTTSRSSRRLNQQEKSAILARNLRSLDPQDAEDLLVKVYTNVGEALRRLGVQVKVLLDVTSSIDSPRSERKSATQSQSQMEIAARENSAQINQIRDEVTQALDLSSLLGQAVDTVYNQVTKVLRVRTEQASQLPLQRFLRYFVLNRMFADECEAISSRSGDTLKEVVNGHIREFLQRFADHQRQSINQTLEVDKWDAKDFGREEQKALARILEGMTRTPPEWVEYTSLWAPPDNVKANGDASMNGGTSDKARPAYVDEQRYVLVGSSLAALHGIEDFQMLIAGIPSLATEGTNRLLEYLKFFNSRCCQLILGAGATRSAGLKNITTKHLALASQACAFIIALLPYMREFVRRQAPGTTSTVLPEFDKVKRLLQDHQSSIHDKLVEIMSQRCNAHIAAMKRVDFEAIAQEQAPSAYVEALCKETSTLHRVLSKHVPEMEVQLIMTPIFEHYSSEWSAALRAQPLATNAGQTRLLKDIEYLDGRLGKLDGAGDFSQKLLAIVKERAIAAPATPAPAPAATDDKAAAPSTVASPSTTAQPPTAGDGDSNAADPTAPQIDQQSTAPESAATADENTENESQPATVDPQET